MPSVSGLHSPLTSGGFPLLLQGASLICQPYAPDARPQRPAGPSSLSPNFSLGWLLSFIRLSSPGSDLPSLINTTNSQSMKIIDEYCTIKIEEFYLSQTEDYSPEDSLPDHSEKLLQRSMVFNSFTCCQNKTLNTSEICFFKFSKQTDRHAFTMPRQLALAPGNEVLLMECQHWRPRKGGSTCSTSGPDALFFSN